MPCRDGHHVEVVNRGTMTVKRDSIARPSWVYLLTLTFSGTFAGLAFRAAWTDSLRRGRIPTFVSSAMALWIVTVSVVFWIPKLRAQVSTGEDRASLCPAAR